MPQIFSRDRSCPSLYLRSHLTIHVLDCSFAYQNASSPWGAGASKSIAAFHWARRQSIAFRPKDTISSKPGENYVHSPFRGYFPTYPVITIFKEPSSLPRSTISSMSRENLWTYAFGRVSLDVPSPLELDSRI